jgi:hypothetical protein
MPKFSEVSIGTERRFTENKRDERGKEIFS